MDAAEPGWSVDVKSCSDKELGVLLQQLRGSEHQAVQLAIKKELIERTRKSGLTTSQIVDKLIWGVPSNKRKEIAAEWSEALGVSEKEFKQLASGK